VGIRDKLAIQRSRLANERTFLAYIRTAIVCFVAGITILKLIPDGVFISTTSILLLLASLFFIAVGLYTYLKIKRELPRDR